MLSDFDFTGARQINSSGRFFLYYSATNPSGLDERLKVYGDGRYFGTFVPGDFIEELPRDVDAWYIEPVTATMSGRVFVGDAKARSNRLTGSVRVIDDSAAKTLLNQQFSAALRRVADATRVSVAGVRTTSKALAIKRLQLLSLTAGTGILFYCTGAPTLGYAAGAPNAGNNKLIGGAVPDHARWSALSTGTTPVVGEFPGYVGFNSFTVPAGVFTDYPLTTPIVIPAGFWFGWVGPAINVEVGYLADAEEIG